MKCSFPMGSETRYEMRGGCPSCIWYTDTDGYVGQHWIRLLNFMLCRPPWRTKSLLSSARGYGRGSEVNASCPWGGNGLRLAHVRVYPTSAYAPNCDELVTIPAPDTEGQIKGEG